MSYKLKNARNNAYSAVIEYTDLHDVNKCIHASEWWNGEGLDITITEKDTDKVIISLHLDDIRALTILFLHAGMVDLSSIQDDLNF